MIESSFRWMKSDLGLRPNYHKKDIRMSSHIFISVLAYYFLATIMGKIEWGGSILKRRVELQTQDDKSDQLPDKGDRLGISWSSIIKMVKKHVRVTTTLLTQDNFRIDIRNSTEPTYEQLIIYKELKITPYPLTNIIHKEKIPTST